MAGSQLATSRCEQGDLWLGTAIRGRSPRGLPVVPAPDNVDHGTLWGAHCPPIRHRFLIRVGISEAGQEETRPSKIQAWDSFFVRRCHEGTHDRGPAKHGGSLSGGWIGLALYSADSVPDEGSYYPHSTIFVCRNAVV